MYCSGNRSLPACLFPSSLEGQRSTFNVQLWRSLRSDLTYFPTVYDPPGSGPTQAASSSRDRPYLTFLPPHPLTPESRITLPTYHLSNVFPHRRMASKEACEARQSANTTNSISLRSIRNQFEPRRSQRYRRSFAIVRGRLTPDHHTVSLLPYSVPLKSSLAWGTDPAGRKSRRRGLFAIALTTL